MALKSMYSAFAFVMVAALSSFSATLEAQTQQAAACAPDLMVSFGIATIECVQCQVHKYAPAGESGTWLTFGTEPTVAALEPLFDGAVDGLRKGDVIVSISGKPITTLEGAMTLAYPSLGYATQFQVRRGGGREVTNATVTPKCVARDGGISQRWRDERASELVRGAAAAALYRKRDSSSTGSGAQGRAASGGGRGAGGSATTGQAAQGGTTGTGSLRFAFASVSMTEFRDSTGTHFIYRVPPTVSQVESGGPAASGGLQAGDILMAVDGLSVTTLAGTRRLSGINTGEKVVFTVDRGGRRVEVTMTAVRR